MSDPAKHDDAWAETPRSNQGSRRPTESGVSRPLTRVYSELELPERGTPGQLGAWPAGTRSPAGNQPAERAGYALGSAAGRARQLKARFQSEAQDRFDELRSRFRVIRGRTSENVQDTASHVKRDARQNLQRVRSRAEFYAHEYPIHFVVGAAGTAFLIGFILGWWRQSE